MHKIDLFIFVKIFNGFFVLKIVLATSLTKKQLSVV